MLPTVSKTALRSLCNAAHQLQSELLEEEGQLYSVHDLNRVLIGWLSSSIESLSEDACDLCYTGDRTYCSFNREVFRQLLSQVPSTDTWDQAAELVQEHRDQSFLSLERVA